MKPELKYNYVILFADDDYWKAILGKELYQHEQIKVYEKAFEGNRFLKMLFRLHWSYSINSKFNLPLKSIWFRKIYNQKFSKERPLCFIYMGANNIRYDGGFTDYVRKRSSKNRQVILHNDLISKKCKYDYRLVRDKVDLATTYDLDEAKKYGISYFCETTYSKLLPEPETVDFKYDVYFLGAAKDRFEKILQVYDKLSNDGLKCLFLIAGVSPEAQVERDGIQYISGISYLENLQYVIESKCILEIIQSDSCDITTRVLEAAAYRRKLLTDCSQCDEAYFNEGQLQKIGSVEDIDTESLKQDYDPNDFPPKLDMDPMNRIYFIEKNIEELPD